MTNAIMGEMNKYSKVLAIQMKKIANTTALQVKKDIRTSAPRKTGVYATNWGYKKTKESPTSIEFTVYVKKKYQLAHLLENGHRDRGGGDTRAFPHIKKAELNGIKKFEKDIQRSMKG